MQQAFLLLLLVLSGLYAALILYYRWSWEAIPNFKLSLGVAEGQTSNPKPQTKISVIIPARNEEKNIAACLDSVCAQSYPNDRFEVLVVDDHSTDNTVSIINKYSTQNVRLLSLKDFIAEKELNSYKKKAIEIAIQQSTGELIVTTDADCIVPGNWLQTIASFYEEYQSEFIAAPVAFLPSPAGEGPGVRFIKIFQALDFMTLQGITGASVYKKMHSMCNGANLAYTKKAFHEVGGFSGIDSIASGDDMLLMHKIYKRYPGKVMFLRSKDAIVETEPVRTIGEFFNQRIRWASKAGKYDDKRIISVLVLVYLINLVLLLLPILMLFIPGKLSIVNYQLSIINLWLVLLLLKTGIELLFLYPVAGFFNKRTLLWLFPVMQPFHILYTVVAGFLGAFGRYTWKERSVK